MYVEAHRIFEEQFAPAETLKVVSDAAGALMHYVMNIVSFLRGGRDMRSCSLDMIPLYVVGAMQRRGVLTTELFESEDKL